MPTISYDIEGKMGVLCFGLSFIWKEGGRGDEGEDSFDHDRAAWT